MIGTGQRCQRTWRHASPMYCTCVASSGVWRRLQDAVATVLPCSPEPWEARSQRIPRPLPWLSAPERGRTGPKNHPLLGRDFPERQVGLGGLSRVPGRTTCCALGFLVRSPGFVITPLAQMSPVLALIRPPYGPFFADGARALSHAHLLSSLPSQRNQTEPDDRRGQSRLARCVLACVSLLLHIS